MVVDVVVVCFTLSFSLSSGFFHHHFHLHWCPFCEICPCFSSVVIVVGVVIVDQEEIRPAMYKYKDGVCLIIRPVLPPFS